MKIDRILYLYILMATITWCALLILAPVLRHLHHQEYSFFIYAFFSKICHQLPERSFYILGEKFAVCERCTAIYFGFLSGVLVYPRFMKKFANSIPSKMYVLIPFLFLIADYIFGYFGFLQNTYTIIFTGSVFGIFISYFIVHSLIESLSSFINIRG
jgi:uncharacterized membrane protein